jgi:RNA polymerase sigma-70 factor (ECF subfamily)
MHDQHLIPDLFRTEFSKICAVLNAFSHFDQPELVEDIASATFQAALETWPYQGVPANPKAWLYHVARNKAINAFRKYSKYQTVDPASLERNEVATEPDMTDRNIQDSQLATLFAICDPQLPDETQIGLALRILCGFGIDEIAAAFMVDKEVINKRLYRGREKLRRLGFDFDKRADFRESRLDHVLLVLYLLFNEGYHSTTYHRPVREELCFEAIRLTSLLLDSKETAATQTHALFALMNFQASRLKARTSADGTEILYDDQDPASWDQTLITTGAYHLHKASSGTTLTAYHLEAAIAFWFTQHQSTPEKWQHILQLYDQLLAIQYSPIAALNRVFAYSKIYGALAAIAEAEKLALESNPQYHLLLGELLSRIDNEKARVHYTNAISLLHREEDRRHVRQRINALD